MDPVEERKQKIILWLKDPLNLILLLVIIFGIGFRLYYFSITTSQPLWWDEADYMAYAKTLAGYPTDWKVTSQHNSLFPFAAGALFKIGLSDISIKFILEIIPSIALIFLTYHIVFLMYKNKSLAIISTILMCVFWENIFYTMRFHLEAPALLFGFLSIYVFWKGYERKEKFFGLNPKWAIPITVILVIITYMIRRGYFLFGLFFLVYMLLTKDFRKLIKDKYNWFALIIAFALLYISEKYIFASGIDTVASTYYNPGPITLLAFRVFWAFYGSVSTQFSPLLYVFFIGVFVLLVNIVLSFGYWKKDTSTKVRSDLFLFLTIAVTMAYFTFYQKRITDFGEPRWYYPMLLGTFVAISRATVSIGDYLKKYYKPLGIIFIVLLLGYGCYDQVTHADFIIKNKIGSYQSVKDAGLFLKDISQEEDVISTRAETQTAYYSERRTVHPLGILDDYPIGSENATKVLQKIADNPNINYFLVLFSEPGNPDWMGRISYNAQGQAVSIEVPFMDTRIDVSTGTQDIKQTKTFEDVGISLNLVTIKGDVFIYEVIRQ
ncbi:MAG: hypothetical protein ABH864_01515 [archaeon]